MDTLSEAMRRAAQDAPLDLGERGAADVSWSRGRAAGSPRGRDRGHVVAALLLVAGVVLAPTGLPGRPARGGGSGRWRLLPPPAHRFAVVGP